MTQWWSSMFSSSDAEPSWMLVRLQLWDPLSGCDPASVWPLCPEAPQGGAVKSPSDEYCMLSASPTLWKTFLSFYDLIFRCFSTVEVQSADLLTKCVRAEARTERTNTSKTGESLPLWPSEEDRMFLQFLSQLGFSKSSLSRCLFDKHLKQRKTVLLQ